jgi:hypothetical protein
MEILSAIFIAFCIYCIIVVTAGIMEVSKPPPPPMDMNSFFKMKNAIFCSTELQRQNCSYAGQRVKAEGRVVEISRMNSTERKSQSEYNEAYRHIILLHVVVEVHHGSEKCLVSWNVKFYKESELFTSHYGRYSKGDRIEFDGRVAKDQGKQCIYLEGIY